MSDDHTDRAGIWLEITNARIKNVEKKKELFVQFKGDKADPRPVWWKVDNGNAEDGYRDIAQALDKKQLVHGQLRIGEGSSELMVSFIRIQYSDSAR